MPYSIPVAITSIQKNDDFLERLKNATKKSQSGQLVSQLRLEEGSSRIYASDNCAVVHIFPKIDTADRDIKVRITITSEVEKIPLPRTGVILFQF
jgi:hypothetical protein